MKVGLPLVELVEAKLNVSQGVLETGAVGKGEEGVGLGGGVAKGECVQCVCVCV